MFSRIAHCFGNWIFQQLRILGKLEEHIRDDYLRILVSCSCFPPTHLPTHPRSSFLGISYYLGFFLVSSLPRILPEEAPIARSLWHAGDMVKFAWHLL